ALPDLHRIRTSGTLPVFRKANESSLKFHTRRTLTATLRLTERMLGNIRLPEVLQYRPSDRFCLVWKSVWSVGRLGVIAEATRPDNIILLLRHPCGVFASRHRGIEQRKMSPVSGEEINELLADRSQTATQLLARIDRADQFDVETFRWALLYSKAINEIADRPGRLIVRYEDLCAHPEREMRRILAAIDLPWDRQVERFIRRSTTTTSPRFYGLHRKPESVDTWRREIPRGVQERVQKIIRGTTAGRFYSSE
ncbi:MAG TPA: sulfotransferase, partial [Planctomycetaceae bacterium]|nr:sulfotransferase [Planctomycetaceae bacterium]